MTEAGVHPHWPLWAIDGTLEEVGSLRGKLPQSSRSEAIDWQWREVARCSRDMGGIA